jgi:hypothetical protein
MKKSITRSKFLTFIFFNLLALFLFLLLYSNIQVFAQPIVPPGLEIAKSVLDANTPILMANSEVVGTALGFSDDGEPVFRFLPNLKDLVEFQVILKVFLLR